MSVTALTVCNSALIKLGADRISSLTQETKSAIILNTIFEPVRDEVLRSHSWRFAMKRTNLSPNATVPSFEYDYTYDLPSDCLRVFRSYPTELDWVAENGVLLTNESLIDIQYIYRVTDPSLWDTLFAEAFAWRLASEAAYALIQSVAVVERCDKKYRELLAEARSISSSEGIVKGLRANRWADARK